jgi:hypothetical protein
MADKNPWPRLTRPVWSGLSILLGIALVVQLLLGVASSVELWSGVMTADSVELSPMVIVFGLASLALLAVWVLTLLLCIVYTCRITFRMMKNLDALEAPGERMSPTMAVVWYFIPFANLYLPYRAVKQIWKGTFELSAEPEPDDGVVLIWWLLWIFSNITGNVALRMSMESGGMSEAGPHDVDLYIASIWVGLASTVLGVLGCWFMLKTFGPLSRTQDAIITARGQAQA